MKRIYLAGPMTHVPQFNVPAFTEAGMNLMLRDFDVVLPADLDDPATRKVLLASPNGAVEDYPGDMTWADFLAEDLKIVADGEIDAVVVLPGWENSRGARLETFVAAALDHKPVLSYPSMKAVGARHLSAAWRGVA